MFTRQGRTLLTDQVCLPVAMSNPFLLKTRGRSLLRRHNPWSRSYGKPVKLSSLRQLPIKAWNNSGVPSEYVLRVERRYRSLWRHNVKVQKRLLFHPLRYARPSYESFP